MRVGQMGPHGAFAAARAYFTRREVPVQASGPEEGLLSRERSGPLRRRFAKLGWTLCALGALAIACSDRAGSRGEPPSAEACEQGCVRAEQCGLLEAGTTPAECHDACRTEYTAAQVGCVNDAQDCETVEECITSPSPAPGGGFAPAPDGGGGAVSGGGGDDGGCGQACAALQQCELLREGIDMAECVQECQQSASPALIECGAQAATCEQLFLCLLSG